MSLAARCVRRHRLCGADRTWCRRPDRFRASSTLGGTVSLLVVDQHEEPTVVVVERIRGHSSSQPPVTMRLRFDLLPMLQQKLIRAGI